MDFNKVTLEVLTCYYLDDKEIVVVADATYLFTNRPSNLENLRRLYSTHKGDFLSKLMIYCSSAGYILQILGAWPANSVYNDSTILKIEAEHDKSLIEFFSSYINSGFTIRLICDRGFRDSRAHLLEQFGDALTVVIPPLQNENIPRKDLSNTDKWRNKGDKLSGTVANGARIVTMERNIIECVNKLSKDWRFFSNKSTVVQTLKIEKTILHLVRINIWLVDIRSPEGAQERLLYI